MKITRRQIFETNSSSTHSLVITERHDSDGYVPKNSTILIRFIDTDDESRLSSLEDKVSYLVSHVISHYKYNSATYEDLISDVEHDHDFQRIFDYVQAKFNKKIVFPTKYDGDLDEIVNINHQLAQVCLEDVLTDLVVDDRDYLEEVLAIDKAIELGRD